MDVRSRLIKAVGALGRYLWVGAALAVAAQVLAAFAFPILEAVLRERAASIPSFVLPVVYIFHLAFGILATWALLKGREFIAATDVATLLTAVEDIERRYSAEQAKVASFRIQTETLLAKSAAVQGSLSVLQGLLQRKSRRGILRGDIESLLAPLTKDRSRALEFASDDLYNFVVYLHDPKADTLNIAFRDCDNRLETHNRSWARGRGHVGSAFAQGMTIVVRDSVKEGTVLSSDTLPTDNRYYASFILAPIPHPNPRAKDPIGLFVMTSNRGGHFDEDDRILADTFSLILSMYICSRSAKATRQGAPGGRRDARKARRRAVNH
jgi:hypothetical protein